MAGDIDPIMTLPPSPKELDESLDEVNIDSGGTHIRQVDKALHPDGSIFVELAMKTRINPEAQPFIDHLIADGIRTGNIEIGFFKDQKPNAAEALTVAHMITQYSINGESRNEFTRILGGLGNMLTAPLRGFSNRNRSNYEGNGNGFPTG